MMMIKEKVMRVLAKTKGMTRNEWLKVRNMGVGGSDAAAILGISPYKSVLELWQEKTGQKELTEAESEILHFGQVLEQTVKEEFTRRTGLKVRAKNAILQSEEYPFMLANLDGVINDNGQMAIFEAKTASAYKKEQWEKGVPPEYMAQLQHYMAVTGGYYSKAYIACIVGGNHFVWYEVPRDEEYIANLIEKEKVFWEEVIKCIEPEMDGSSATSEYLAKMYADSNKNTVNLPDAAKDLFVAYDDITEKLFYLNKKKEEIANQFKFFLKEDETGVFNDRRVSWKAVTSNRLDSKKLKDEEPAIYEKYLTSSSYRRMSVA